MKLNFCTLFNSSYLTRGLAMYQSLLEHCDDFHLYIYAFDDICYEYLKKQSFKNLTVISLKEFENEELLRIKPTRSAGEYCWTCASSTIYHAITNFELNNCTYIDADMLFYSNPRVLIDEMKDKSVLITSHRYTPEYDNSVLYGKYCVQFMTFKNTPEGMTVLNWWKDACIDWCYAKVEDGKFGDQKYIDEFTTRFTGVHELEHLGGGVAPWNAQQYTFEKQGNTIIGIEKATEKKFELVFYHFHWLKFYENEIVLLTGTQYALSDDVKKNIYYPYIIKLIRLRNYMVKEDKSLNPNGINGKSPFKPKITIFTLFKLYTTNFNISFSSIFGLNLRKLIKQHHYFDVKLLKE